MANQNPQRVELGELLKGARERAALGPGDVEKVLGWYRGKNARVEAGSRVPVYAEVSALADLYRMTADERTALRVLADAARKRESSARVADFAQTYVKLERAANDIWCYDAMLVPAVLQVEAYARALLVTSRSGDVEPRLADRMARQSILTAQEPPTIRALLGEAVLHQEVGGRAVLMKQLARLLDVGQLPNVSVRIISFTHGAHRAMGVGFVYLRMDSLRRVYLEGLTDATYLHEHDDVDAYEQGFEGLWAEALDEVQSATILRRRIEEPSEENHGALEEGRP